jgi:C4-dicarboxylate transporter
MQLLLGAFYYIIGLLMAVFWSSAAGFGLCVPICLFRLFRHRRNVLLMLMYIAAAAVCAAICLGLGRLTEAVAAKTDYAVYWMMFVGLAIPGLGTLALIPAYIRIALRQTSGVMDPA